MCKRNIAKTGNVCKINDRLCVIVEDKRDEIRLSQISYYAIGFDGGKYITNCPIFVAENISKYMEQHHNGEI